jgi:hypothetical protein
LCISHATLSLQRLQLISARGLDFVLSSSDCCILDAFPSLTSMPSMQIQTPLPDSVVALMTYVDDAGLTENAELVVQIMMSSVHPDFESSVATAAFLPADVRMNVSGFLNSVLVQGISDEQRSAIFCWTQCWALASLDQ